MEKERKGGGKSGRIYYTISLYIKKNMKRRLEKLLRPKL